MSLKDILIQIDNNPASQRRLRLAATIARHHDAHLIALYCVEPLPIPVYSPWGDPGFSNFPATEQAVERYRAAAFDTMTQIELTFRAETERTGISSEWRVGEGAGTAPLIQQACCVDLTILGQTDPGQESIKNMLPEEVMLVSGRPALLVPAVGDFETVGQRILIAWNASREAARALGDALPLLADAQAVTVLSIGSTDVIEAEYQSANVTRHLARHGVNATAATCTAAESNVGDALLSRAADLGADLIVMGAYGHSRIHEWLLGGVTRHVLRHMTVPVFMAH